MRHLVRQLLYSVLLGGLGLATLAEAAPDIPPPGTSTEFIYHRLGNTGVQGDWSESLWIGPDGNPWIGGYDPTFEEGGLAKFIEAEDRFVSVSNVDYPILGHPNDVGTSRVLDITPDRTGQLWFATWTALFRMDPAVGGRSLVRYDLDGAGAAGGGSDVDAASDGTIWVAASGQIVQLYPTSGRVNRWDGGFEHIAVQPKPSNGYFVWATMESTGIQKPVWRYDSATRLWEVQSETGQVGEVAYLRGTDVVDDAGNLWAIHSDRQWDPILTLGYRRPDGSWVDVPAPNQGGPSYINSLKAYGRANALLADASGRVWKWDGRSWEDLGIGGPSNAALGIVGLDINVASGAVWTSGDGGAARRDPATGQWQRYRITNCSQGDNFVLDLSLTPTGEVWSTANLGPGVGGFQHFDGTRWRGFNALNHGLPGSGPFPFPSDSTFAIEFRPSNGHVALGMPGGGVQEWTGSGYVDLGLANWSPTRLLEDSLGRLWAGSEDAMIGLYEHGAWTTFDGAFGGGSPTGDPDRLGWVWLSGWEGSIWTDGTTKEVVPIGLAHGSAPIGNGKAWVGSDGLYLVDQVSKTWEFYAPGVIAGHNPHPFGVSPDGILWYGCDEGLCWADTKNRPLRPGGVFYAPAGGEPQWGGLPWWPIRAELRAAAGHYEIWMTTPSRGITVLKVTPRRSDRREIERPSPAGGSQAPARRFGVR